MTDYIYEINRNFYDFINALYQDTKSACSTKAACQHNPENILTKHYFLLIKEIRRTGEKQTLPFLKKI